MEKLVLHEAGEGTELREETADGNRLLVHHAHARGTRTCPLRDTIASSVSRTAVW